MADEPQQALDHLVVSPGDEPYMPPTLVALGSVRAMTLGNSASGNADSNSQYYW